MNSRFVRAARRALALLSLQPRAVGPRAPSEGRRRPATSVLVGMVAFLIAAAGIAWAVGSAGRSASRSAARTSSTRLAPPAAAIIFDTASSDSVDARIEIAYVRAGGGAVVPLTSAWKSGMVAAEPRWSPDGSQIAFVMSPRGYLPRYAGDGDIYVMNADGSGIRRLTGGLGASSPAWSPDGSRIAFVEGQGQGLAVMRADGSDQRVIAQAQSDYGAPAWSPDGATIAFASSPNGNIGVAYRDVAYRLQVKSAHGTAIFTIHPDGTHERQLTPASASSGFPSSPAWSPDGSRIAYSAGDQLWLMNSDGTGARRLTNCRLPCVFAFAPTWSPNGKDLAFVRQENDGAARHLYILELAAGAVRPLTPDIGWANSPDWRPPRR